MEHHSSSMDVDPPENDTNGAHILPTAEEEFLAKQMMTKLQMQETQTEHGLQSGTQIVQQQITYSSQPASSIADARHLTSQPLSKPKKQQSRWFKPLYIVLCVAFAIICYHIYFTNQEIIQLKTNNRVLEERIYNLEQYFHEYELSSLNIQEKQEVIKTPVYFSKDASRYKHLILNELNQFSKSHPKKFGRTRYVSEFVEADVDSISSGPVVCVEPCISDRTDETLKECRKLKEDTSSTVIGLALRRSTKCTIQGLNPPSFSSYQVGSKTRTFLAELFYDNFDPSKPSIVKCFENEQRIQELNEVLISIKRNIEV